MLARTRVHSRNAYRKRNADMSTNLLSFKELDVLLMHAQTEILAFPCNQFGYQESGCDVDIKEFAKKKGAQFTMMSKIDVVRACLQCVQQL